MPVTFFPSGHRAAMSRRTLCLQIGFLTSGAMLLNIPHVFSAPRKRRIVSIDGAITEILFALQAQEDLVGVDTTSLYPEAVQKLPNVGYARALSVEGILALAPTQVITTTEAGPPAVLRRLTMSGVEVTTLVTDHRFEGLLERIEHIGALTDRKPQATALQDSLRRDWEQTQARRARKTTNPARILFILAHAPNQIMVAGTGTSAHAMIEYSGSINAISKFSGYKPLTPEAVVSAQPDIILLTTQGLETAGSIDGILRQPGLDLTPAGRNRHIITMEAMFLLGFGPRLPKAVSVLSKMIEDIPRS